MTEELRKCRCAFTKCSDIRVWGNQQACPGKKKLMAWTQRGIDTIVYAIEPSQPSNKHKVSQATAADCLCGICKHWQFFSDAVMKAYEF